MFRLRWSANCLAHGVAGRFASCCRVGGEQESFGLACLGSKAIEARAPV